MGSILEKKICSYSLFPIFKVGIANLYIFYLLSRDKCVCHYFDAQFLKLESLI